MTTDILTVSCPSKRGIVAAISGYLASQGCSISDSSQFDDVETGTFFMRVSFVSEEGKALSEIAEGFTPIGQDWNMDFKFHDSSAWMPIRCFNMGRCPAATDLPARLCGHAKPREGWLWSLGHSVTNQPSSCWLRGRYSTGGMRWSWVRRRRAQG